MLDAAREALSFVEGRSRVALDKDRGLLLSVVQCVQIIGEAAGRVSATKQRALPGIPWPAIIGMRNRLVHAHPPARIQEACLDHEQRGPTCEEVEAGDYTNFPWQRRNGRFARDARPVPILRKGSEPPRCVAFSDGSLRWLSDSGAEALFRADPGQE